jgi:hypothetical protein
MYICKCIFLSSSLYLSFSGGTFACTPTAAGNATSAHVSCLIAYFLENVKKLFTPEANLLTTPARALLLALLLLLLLSLLL